MSKFRLLRSSSSSASIVAFFLPNMCLFSSDFFLVLLLPVNVDRSFLWAVEVERIQTITTVRFRLVVNLTVGEDKVGPVEVGCRLR